MMKTWAGIIGSVLLVALFTLGGGCSKSTAPSQDGGDDQPDVNLTLRLDPGVQAIGVTDTLTFQLLVGEAQSLFGISAEISFADTVLCYPATIVTVGSMWTAVPLSQVVEEPGRLNICLVLAQTSGVDGISGAGDLLSLRLGGLAAGTTDVVIENLQMLDENGNPIAGFGQIQVTNGNVTVTN